SGTWKCQCLWSLFSKHWRICRTPKRCTCIISACPCTSCPNWRRAGMRYLSQTWVKGWSKFYFTVDMQQVASQYAPSPKVVVPFYGAGSLFFLAGCLMISLYPELFVGHYFSPGLLAITHLLVLGWVTMIIMGALSQMIPVILESPLH